MANTFLFANNANTTLAAPINAVAVALTVASGTGALFPNPSPGQQFSVTLIDAATGVETEIVYCTARSGDTLTIVRGQEGTTGQSWIAGDLVANMPTAGQMEAMQQTSALNPNRIVNASGVFAMSTSDAGGAVGLNRVSTPAVSSTTLPISADGDEYLIEDLAKNFNTYNVTVNPNPGSTIQGMASVKLNINGQCAKFRFYEDDNVWSFKP